MREYIVIESGRVMRKKNKYFIIAILILIIATSLCACSTKSTEICQICFISDRHITFPIIGEFKLASISNDNYSRRFEVLPHDKENFIKFMKKSEYYIGTFKISEDSYYLNEKKEYQVFKAGDECMWFAGQDYVWMGKFYANKFYYLTYIPMQGLRDSNISAYVSQAIFTNVEEPKEVGVEYKCPWSCEQLKMIYHDHKIYEENYSIEVDCYLHYKEENPDAFFGTTQLCCNKNNNTIKISSDYTIKELTEEDLWQFLE